VFIYSNGRPQAAQENFLNMKVGRLISASLCACLLLCASVQAFAQAAPSRVIAADYNRVKGARDRFPHLVVGAGRAAEGLRADWQRDLALVRRECGFEYVRVQVKAPGRFSRDLPMRENDVYLLTLLPASADRGTRRGR
jgi:hypothetical protein